MKQKPFNHSIIDLFDIVGEKQFNQLPHIHFKDYSGYQSDKNIGNGEGQNVFYFGLISFNDNDKEGSLFNNPHEVFNNFITPGLFKKQ